MKYEFGNKVSIIRSVTDTILGAMSNMTVDIIEPSLKQVEQLTGQKIKI